MDSPIDFNSINIYHLYDSSCADNDSGAIQNNEWRGFFLLAVLMQIVITVVLTVIAYFVAYI